MCKKILVVLLVLGMVGAAGAADLVNEDFTTDPGWIELNTQGTSGHSTAYEWDYGYQATGGNTGGAGGGEMVRADVDQHYAVDLGVELGTDVDWTVDFDMYLTDDSPISGCGEMVIGLTDLDVSVQQGAFENVTFAGWYVYPGGSAYAVTFGNGGRVNAGNFSQGGSQDVWQAMSMDYDSDTGTLTMTVGANVHTETLPNNLVYDSFMMMGNYDTGHQSVWDSGVNLIDNVVITPEPATMVLLGLGGLALIRRKR